MPSPLPAAVLNAVYDATGVRFHSVPLHPETVLRALEEAEPPNA